MVLKFGVLLLGGFEVIMILLARLQSIPFTVYHRDESIRHSFSVQVYTICFLQKVDIVSNAFVHYLLSLDRAHFSAWPDRACWLLEMKIPCLGFRVEYAWCVCRKWEDYIVFSLI